jgi:hypothetical protein
MNARHNRSRLGSVFMAWLVASPALTAASDVGAEWSGDEFNHEVSVQAGWIAVLDGADERDEFVGIEARLASHWRGIRPWLGLSVVDSGTWFAGGGISYDFMLPCEIRVIVGGGAFYYHAGEIGDDLGYELEFIAFIELTRELRNGMRLGLRHGHISNTGIGRMNPGTETLAIIAVFPFGRGQQAPAQWRQVQQYHTTQQTS